MYRMDFMNSLSMSRQVSKAARKYRAGALLALCSPRRTYAPAWYAREQPLRNATNTNSPRRRPQPRVLSAGAIREQWRHGSDASSCAGYSSLATSKDKIDLPCPRQVVFTRR